MVEGLHEHLQLARAEGRYISPMSPLYLRYISPTSPLYQLKMMVETTVVVAKMGSGAMPGIYIICICICIQLKMGSGAMPGIYVYVYSSVSKLSLDRIS